VAIVRECPKGWAKIERWNDVHIAKKRADKIELEDGGRLTTLSVYAL